MTDYIRPIQVVLTCNKEYINEEAVEFVDISEDFQGHDVMTYRCPRCGEIHNSYRLG